MNSPHPAPAAPSRDWARRLVNLLVALVVIAVAGAAFVFSYGGVHAIALLGGVSAQLARYYPGLFDAVLVIACVAAIMLRDGRWWARLWAWVVLIVVLGAIGTTDVLHAMNYTLRHRPTEGIVAAAPVAAVLLAFSLLLTLLRRSRTQAPQPTGPAPLDIPALPAAISVPPMALPAAAATPVAPAVAPTELQAPFADLAAIAPMPAAATVAAPATETESWPQDAPAPDAAPPRAEPVLSGALDVPQKVTPQEAHPVTALNEVIAPEAPATRAAPVAPAEEDAPAPPTVQVPALSPEPAATRPQSIRYAGKGVPWMAAKPQAAGRDTPPAEDYWDSEDAGQFAGLVYPPREDGADLDDPAASDDDDADDEVSDAEPGQSPARKTSPELDDDAPPFATAPFAPVPRLNRVRSTPTPPADEDE
jgi:Protein of unknown function (DUF2637)